MTRESASRIVKNKAAEWGFDFCGIARARRLDEEEKNLENWLNKGFHGQMAYMENHFEKRLDPRKLVPGAKSVISLLYNYYPEDDINHQKSYKVAKYAFGKDYHRVVKKKLKTLVTIIQQHLGAFQGRVFVDSAPVMERQWAKESGLGWIGKNSLLLNRNMGSFFFIAEIISDLDLQEDHPIGDYCGTCTRCIDGCPTDAIVADGVVDANRCISYLTIELKDRIPVHLRQQYGEWVFGCDICQDVCPWNRFSSPAKEDKFSPSEKLRSLSDREWEELTEQVFEEIASGTPLRRAGYHKMKDNIGVVKK